MYMYMYMYIERVGEMERYDESRGIPPDCMRVMHIYVYIYMYMYMYMYVCMYMYMYMYMYIERVGEGAV
jgi:hypothetical protein